MVSTLIASRWSWPQSQILSSLCWLLMLVFSWAHRGSTWEILLNSNSLWAMFYQIIDSLFLCDNVLHKLELLYSSLTRLCFKRNPAESRAQIWRHNAPKPPVVSAAVHSLAMVLSLLIAPNFITRWYSLIKFCIRMRVNIVQTLACVTVSFNRQGFAEHQSGG